MADEYAFRDFVGNLYPPPSTKGLMDVPVQTAATSVAATPVDAPPPEEVSPAAATKAKGIYRVVDRPDGTRRMYYSGPDGKTIDRGTVIAPTETLNTVGKYSAQGKLWDIPEEYAKKFERGNPGFLEHIANSFNGAEAGMHTGLVGYLALTKQMPYDEAIDRTDPELVKAQLTDLPQAAWGDSRLQKIVGASKWALGAAAEVLPSLIGGAQAGMAEAPKVALAATAVAAAGGPAGLAALATPPAILTVAGMSWKYGAFDFTSKVTAGSLALEMKRKGLDDKTIETVAPIAGMFAGALEILHVKYLPAPFRRALAAKVFSNGAAKKAMTHWLTNYFKETGAEVSVEVAQQYIEGFATNIMASMDERPDVAKSWASMNTEAGKVALKTAVGMGLIKVPGAAFEAFSAPGAEGAPALAAKAKAAAPAAEPPRALSLAEKAIADSEIKPTAPAIEQELVKDSPEVATALSELNAELDSTAEDAEMAYSFIGEEMAGDENVDAAVIAKVEALRSEMRDILAEDANTPEEQNRVVDIQREIGLLEGMQEKMAVAPAVSETTTPAPAKRPITGAKARVQKQIVAAREKKLVTDLNNTLAMVKELETSRTRLEKAGRSVVFINNEIAKLMGEVYAIDEARAKLAETGEVAKGDVLEMKPATLASITEAAFKEGRADVTKKRALFVQSVAEENSLTDGDVRRLIKTRNLGVMSDLDFKTFLDDLRVRAKALAEKKQALNELHATQRAKGLKKEDSLRKINNLPPVSKMTAEQMRQYAELIEGYEAGETFWTPKRIEALKNTRWSGAETMEDVLRMAAELFNVPLEDLAKVTMSELDRFRYDTSLARRHPLYNFMVDEVKLSALKNDAAYFAEREQHFRLAEAAAKSRAALDSGKKSVWERLKQWAAPQQKEVMAYLEAETAEEKTAAAAALTPEELKLAQFEEEFYRRAYEYLLAGGDLKSSRFADGGYVFHARRPLSEILRDIRDTGVKAAVSDFLTMWKTDETRFNAVDSQTGKALGLRKFFRQTLFRSGELTPSKNVVRSTDVYMRQFFKKKALDEAVPSVETLTMAVASIDKTEEGKQMGAALHAFVKEYLNAKKGKAAITGVAQGGKIDALIRFTTNLISIHMMGFNTVIQIASPIGETVAKIPVLGVGGLAKAVFRGRTKQGRAISAKYKFFTGEGVIEEFVQPGQNIETKVAMLAYGLFKWSRANTMRDLILGNMTPQEFAAGEMSTERLAEIKKLAGRWIDVGDAKSIIGTTSTGKAYTQFKSWAIPIMSSSLDILNSTIQAVKTGNGKAISPMQRTEIVRVLQATALVALVSQLAGDADRDDDSYLGRLKFTVMREMSTLLQAVNPVMFLATPATAAWMYRLAQNIQMWITLQKSKTTGELMGYQRLKKQLTPAIVRQIAGAGDGKKPKGPPKPVKFKREER